ncbi:hypothetical protein NECAME_01980 [Necator americanus]|uniref:Uncharacterized protein n=1 Tax=Necator americanus TaxID=51031 RepID=W2TKR9_NECAM|nr:hypothetical protein NECAME_01980 [Necator americanus]ETN82695.1 hypothetical protein NECAME_01980 [Necator americanus]
MLNVLVNPKEKILVARTNVSNSVTKNIRKVNSTIGIILASRCLSLAGMDVKKRTVMENQNNGKICEQGQCNNLCSLDEISSIPFVCRAHFNKLTFSEVLSIFFRNKSIFQ